MKKYFSIFALIIIFAACNNNPVTPQKTEITKEETVIESKSITFDQNGGDLKLSDGCEVIIPSGSSNNITLTVKKIKNDAFFSGNNRVSLDISTSADIPSMTVKIKVPANLKSEDLGLFRYNSNSKDSILKGEIPQFSYDAQKGILNAEISFSISKKGGSKIQAANVLNRWIAEWDENTEPISTTKLIQMPFYEQPGNSCWATSSVMFSKGFTPYTDKRSEVEVCNILRYCGLTRDAGIYPYQFLGTLMKAIHFYTGAGVESTGYFRLSALKEKLISELDKDHPVIISLPYPNVGAHAIMVVGYKKEGAGTTEKITLIIHNPQGTGSETMYTEHDFDWVFQNKSSVQAIQIIYPTQATHADRTLLTVGMPLGATGEIKFNVPYKSTSYNVALDENISDSKGYGWKWGDKFMNSIPDSAKDLIIKLPIWNADRSNQKNAKMDIFITKSDESKSLYEKMDNLTIPVGTSAYWYNLSIPVTSFRRTSGSKNYSIFVRLYENDYNYADGFNVDVVIDSKVDSIPVIQSITPLNANPDEIVTIKGFNFFKPSPIKSGDIPQVTFNGTKIYSYYDWSDTLIKCIIPKYATTGDVIVTSLGKASKGFYYEIGKSNEIILSLKLDTSVQVTRDIYPNSQTFKKVSYNTNLTFAVNGTIKGNNLSLKLRENLWSVGNRWVYDYVLPGNLSYEANLNFTAEPASQKLEWSDVYNDTNVIIKAVLSITQSSISDITEYFNNTGERDIFKYIPFSHSATSTGDKSAKYLFSTTLPSLQEIDKIVVDHNISPFEKRLFATAQMNIRYKMVMQIFDSKTNLLMNTETKTDIDVISPYVNIICDFK